MDSAKIKALRDYRRAQSLCFKCGEHWGHDHICPTSVQLHVVEELLELFGINTVFDSNEQVPAPETTKEVYAISRPALTGGVSSKAFQLRAWIQGHEVLMLVDSGGSTSFFNQRLFEQLEGVKPMPRACKVKVVDGGELICSAMVHQCRWYTQGCEFETDMKILQLGTYDAILRMDWLEAHSPMTVDWRAKHLEFKTATGTACLQGHESNSATCYTINSVQLQGLCKQQAVSLMVQVSAVQTEQEQHGAIPPVIQQLLDDFPDVFGEPVGLPPRHACDHHIPLLPGAQPVNIRPYRHKPDHKDEIERQVAELLRTWVIQHSTSPFSSPVILVKKKDGTWRLCIDYRHLNALTRISKYPVPVIEELLDELHGAKWFSKLDLRAGYHQIRLAEGEEYKTAFQTHSGHFEFKVLSFGLVGAPPTFLGAMNVTLKPGLRKYVLVFFDDILVFSKTLEDHKEHLREVLTLLHRDHWKVNLAKCAFGQQEISYLGHVISAQGVATDPNKIKAVAEWKTPTDTKIVRSFLGLVGYYRRFVRNFGVIAKPLFNLLKKGVPFVWTAVTDAAFQALKH